MRQNVYETDTARTIDTGGNPPDSNQGGVAVVADPAAYAMTMCGFPQVSKEQAPTLLARDFKDPTAVSRGYTVRRLTPTECARLQGLCSAKKNAKLFVEAAKIGANPQIALHNQLLRGSE